MRKARWAAAAAGVVLLTGGCSGARDDTSGTSQASPSAAPAKASGSLDAAATTQEIVDAATAAGFTQEPSEGLPASLKNCAVSWLADVEKAADPQKSYDRTLAALKKAGWKQARELTQQGSAVTSLKKSGWTLRAGYYGRPETYLAIHFQAWDTSAECEKAANEELAKKQSS
ncbi:hypothetical protein OG317_35740 [Streptomyces sp. NBC_01167]|uniref:hypothetical protein n=1 Tax=Streptomyces sp. NBC_01167 TaxID=2903756 RepID=UPI00386A6070|nr:hypothetical protein OG317_35740 [Streptomyces sp. NBC_01167]